MELSQENVIHTIWCHVLICQTVGLTLLQTAVSQAFGTSLRHILQSEQNRRTKSIYNQKKRRNWISKTIKNLGFRLEKSSGTPKINNKILPLQLQTSSSLRCAACAACAAGGRSISRMRSSLTCHHFTGAASAAAGVVSGTCGVWRGSGSWWSYQVTWKPTQFGNFWDLFVVLQHFGGSWLGCILPTNSSTWPVFLDVSGWFESFKQHGKPLTLLGSIGSFDGNHAPRCSKQQKSQLGWQPRGVHLACLIHCVTWKWLAT